MVRPNVLVVAGIVALWFYRCRAPIRLALHAWLQVTQPNGEVIITNDGATILNKMTVTQPAAKMLVELAKAQVRLSISSMMRMP